MSIPPEEEKEPWASKRGLGQITTGASTDLFRSKSINSRTATVDLDFRASKERYSMPPLTWFVPSPAEILVLLPFPQLASSGGKQPGGRRVLCPLSARATRTAGM